MKNITVPDLGGATDVVVIEVLVKPGDRVKKDSPLVALESDKATMELPSSDTGVVKELKVKVGDKIQEGSTVLTLEVEGAAGEVNASGAAAASTSTKAETSGKDSAASRESSVDSRQSSAASSTQSAVSSQGSAASRQSSASSSKDSTASTKSSASDNHDSTASEAGHEQASNTASAEPKSGTVIPAYNTDVHAGPAVRKLAREFGVDLAQISATGPKDRIVKEDIQNFVKSKLAQVPAIGGSALPAAPVVDFNKFGMTETVTLTRIKKLTGKNLHRNWVLAPHVTQFGEADITDMDEFRQAHKASFEKQGVKMTPLVFIMKAVAATLKMYPQFNSSLDATGENLILKKYCHIGVAVDTEEGLVVPVIRDVDKKGLKVLAKELAVMSDKARNKQLLPADMQGACFSISSLGGIGGTAFTPIINLPEVAILGVSKASYKPVYINNEFVPRLMLPLSLSYDHRVIDGADGARFIAFMGETLGDIRSMLL